MSTGITYKNPPLKEVVFELFFTSSKWNSVMPGLFYSLIKEKFPIINKKNGFEFALDPNGVKIGGTNNEMLQFKNSSGDTIIQLAPGLLTVNKLPQYTGWADYLKIIKTAVDTLQSIVEIERIDRIGLKTINRIEIDDFTVENFKRYFTIYTEIPFSKYTSSYQLNIEIPIIPNIEVLAISMISQIDPSFKAPILFQIYVTQIKNIVASDIYEWIEDAHNRVNEAFNNCLTDECKERY
ncbi:MAG: TIGR04255 family protein [Bacteroidota bacterium]|nr:TIGR04255 family protein [Bacteroidota bacterium]